MKIDATVESGVAGEFGVQGYPTLFYFMDGQKQDYQGPRQKDGIISWIESRERETIEDCSAEKLKKLLSDEDRSDSDPAVVLVAKVVKKSGKYAAVKKGMSKFLAEERLGSFVACME